MKAYPGFAHVYPQIWIQVSACCFNAYGVADELMFRDRLVSLFLQINIEDRYADTCMHIDFSFVYVSFFLDYLLKIITSMKNVTVLKTMAPVFWGEAELFGIFDKGHHSGKGSLLWVCYL